MNYMVNKKVHSTPLVFTITGEMAPEAIRFLKRVAEKVSAKTREKNSQVMSNIRTRISFKIMKNVPEGANSDSRIGRVCESKHEEKMYYMVGR